MSEGFNIREVISKSTSDVSLTELAKKGFKRVKVLNKDAINGLVEEAVHRVVIDRLKEATSQEREQIYSEARAEVDRLIARHKEEARHLDDLEKRLQDLRDENQKLRDELAKASGGSGAGAVLGQALKEALLEIKKDGTPSADGAQGLKELKASIESLAAQIQRSGIRGGGAGGGTIHETADALLESLFQNVGDAQVENNLNKVKVKNAKAQGVSKTLEKLRSLQKGGEDGD